ncbi:unnamed protein product [Didymodactylos carnosus]|uniref:Uncharacterized protein n=1 Tax=Didymodactylos carnosus TaxID=1234261 RepID=A0A814I4P8_9BILA|nr:unnamed protein product [Didymodactylos carnosus]CAF1018252.1 unnamed protein product [Didymodactylos carnosus]CAF3580553.1 unnamed protein product [Didymodactylos carnosus]CAF3789714.1 unnamed protein product [Didymodactylos carnosus]
MNSILYLLVFVFLISNSNQTRLLTHIQKSYYSAFVNRVASGFHSLWRITYLEQYPCVKNRFKLTNDKIYKANFTKQDFIYPMIISVTDRYIKVKIHQNMKIGINEENDKMYIDIFNMIYSELPSDWRKENHDTASIACYLVLKSIFYQQKFTQEYIEDMTIKIHDEWIKRNKNRTSSHLKLPYHLLSSIEKKKDRQAILIAIQIFRFYRLDRIFNTTRIEFV